MGCTASKPGLVNEFRDVKIEQIQNAKLTPPTVGQVVAQPKQPAAEEAPKKPNLQPQPGFFDANLTFANVVWNSPSTAPKAGSKPALNLKSAAPPAAAPKKAEAKAPAPPPEQPKPAAAAVPAWPVRPEDAWAQDPDGWDDYDEDEDEEDDATGRVVDPDMFRTRVNHANFEWEGTPEHTDVAPKKDDKQMVNPFAGVPLGLPAAAAKAPAAAAAPKASPLEQAANAIKAAEAKPLAAPSLASPFAGGGAAKPAAPPAAKPAAPAAMASPFAAGAGAKPLAGGAADAQAAAMQSILMNGTAEQQTLMRTILQNQAQAQARSRAQAAFATAPGAGGVYPAVAHAGAAGAYPSVQHAGGANPVPSGFTNEMLMQQIAQARMQQHQMLQQQQRQAAAGAWMG